MDKCQSVPEKSHIAFFSQEKVTQKISHKKIHINFSLGKNTHNTYTRNKFSNIQPFFKDPLIILKCRVRIRLYCQAVFLEYIVVTYCKTLVLYYIIRQCCPHYCKTILLYYISRSYCQTVLFNQCHNLCILFNALIYCIIILKW